MEGSVGKNDFFPSPSLAREESGDNSSGEWLTGSELSRMLEELCHSKAEEFTFFGYENIKGQDIWACVSQRYKKGMPPLHQVVNDILSLKINDYMNWAMVQAYKGSS